MIEKSDIRNWLPGFYEPFLSAGSKIAGWFQPAAEARSDEDAYEIRLEVPGIEKDDLELTLEDGLLTISGEKETVKEEKRESYYFSERQYGSFSRSFRLPGDANSDAISADTKNGVLTIRVPKDPEPEPSGRKIEVKAA
ncbi:MAG: Hsp20/alpha crystallin family protein [Rhodobacteraceae bacterium]|nr:Hsp20/alpha crystallin family protein [Paracoccaceae bacterium]